MNDVPFPAPPGKQWELRRDLDWAVPPRGAGRCRFFTAGHACGATPVASFRRGTTVRTWWDYCAVHLYGRQFIEGEVRCWRLVDEWLTP